MCVVSSKRWRERLAVDRLGVDPAKAPTVVDETDEQHDRYVQTYDSRHRQDVTNYDIVLTAERLGFEAAAGLVVAEVRRRGSG
ncbi:MAG TPA: cytidylate kinase family protein [Gemmatimonadales bacterium]